MYNIDVTVRVNTGYKTKFFNGVIYVAYLTALHVSLLIHNTRPQIRELNL